MGTRDVENAQELRVTLALFFIYSAPGMETLCSTHMAWHSGTITARSSPDKSSLNSRYCSSTC